MAEHIDWDAMFANVKPQDDGEHIEHEKQTRQNCFHYKCCSDFGLVLDPLHGGVICDTFVSTADVAPVVHGRWVGLEYNGYADGCPVYDLWECSECGEEVSGEDVPITHPWCHGCGARMDGE